jgi:hypothetical protein
MIWKPWASCSHRGEDAQHTRRPGEGHGRVGMPTPACVRPSVCELHWALPETLRWLSEAPPGRACEEICLSSVPACAVWEIEMLTVEWMSWASLLVVGVRHRRRRMLRSRRRGLPPHPRRY